jgi:hypothetical protein
VANIWPRREGACPGIVEKAVMEGFARTAFGGGPPVATDTRLGLVIGLGVVLAVAVIYFPKAGHPDRATAVVPSLPGAVRGTESALRPPAQTPTAQFNRQ